MDVGVVFIVDDDDDDKEILEQAWSELEYKAELKFFSDGEEVVSYLQSNNISPFLIISDVNLPKMDGIALKKNLQENETLNYKTIPFVFFSTSASNEQIKRSYDFGTNGFFIKEQSFNKIKETLNDIVHYWIKSKVPE